MGKQKKNLVPKNLDVKIGSKREAFLTKQVELIEKEIEMAKNTIDMNEILLKGVRAEILSEKQKFK